MKRIVLGSGAMLLFGVLPSCFTPHAPEDLPGYSAGSPAIDNDDWSGTLNQAQWKERPGLNEDLMHQGLTGQHRPVGAY